MWSAVRAALFPIVSDLDETVASRPGQARDAAERAARNGADLVVAIGGDGTLHETLNGLMQVPQDRRPALAFVPGGTANIFARALGLPTSPSGVAHLFLGGVRRRIDVGQVNDRYYATIAGVGFDGEVVARASRWPRWGGGKTIHVAAILATLATFRPPSATITLDGVKHVLSLTFLVAANTDWYGGGLHIAPGARPDDGRLAVVYATGLTRVDTLAVILRALSGRHLGHPRVAHTAATAVRVEADPPLGIHADGEWLGRGPATFGIVPQALDILVPDGTMSIRDARRRP